MGRLILDSSAVTALTKRNKQTAKKLNHLKCRNFWPPVIPSAVLVECLSGRQRTDAAANRFIKSCHIDETLPERVARQAGTLRYRTGRASRISAVDAIAVAMAEPDGVVISSDIKDMTALAAQTRSVSVQQI